MAQQDVYLVRDWSGVTSDPHTARPVGETVNAVVHGQDVFEVIDRAKREGRKISVYVLGECVLDWS